MSDHDVIGCQCSTCKRMAAGATREEAFAEKQKWEAEMLKQYGWYAHYITDPKAPTGFECHTHGIPEKNDGQLDFEIVCPLRQETAHSLFATIVDRVKAGERFMAGQVVDEIAGNGYKVKLVLAREAGRDVLRIIVPDKDGNLDAEKMDDFFRKQYADLPSRGLVA